MLNLFSLLPHILLLPPAAIPNADLIFKALVVIVFVILVIVVINLPVLPLPAALMPLKLIVSWILAVGLILFLLWVVLVLFGVL